MYLLITLANRCIEFVVVSNYILTAYGNCVHWLHAVDTLDYKWFCNCYLITTKMFTVNRLPEILLNLPLPHFQ